VLAVLACAGFGRAQPARSPDAFLRDAELADVFFLDAERGWAVGDRGVIWHTADGGRHWGRQTAPVACRLESVCFVDDRNGWIGGGWSHPYTPFSTGVVLRTTDGGKRWEAVPRLSLPRLRRLAFLDLRNGWAVGEASGMYPAGVFQTSDGGRSWSSVIGAQHDGWLTGDFPDTRMALVGGRYGALSAVRPTGLEPAAMPAVGIRNVRCVRVARQWRATADGNRAAGQPPLRLGWLVGDGDLVLRTTDGGRTWHEPPARLPDGMYDEFDYRAVAVWGERCWIAGAPGSRVLHSADGGQSWSVFATGQNLPLRALTFLDPERGWVVGSLGTILATRDGGRTWVRQQQDSGRVALLGLFTRPAKLPLELLASVSGGDGYLSAVELLHRADADHGARALATLEQRAHDAVVSAGGSQADTAWCFPLPPPGVPLPASQNLLGRWEPGDPTRGLQRLEERLVRAVRQWQPDVVVTEPASPRGDEPLAHLVNQVVLSAIERAADAAAYPGQLSRAGLAPWKVSRLFSVSGADAAGPIHITTAQLIPPLGCSIADQAGQAWQLLRQGPQAPPPTIGLRLLVNRRPDGDAGGGLFSGIGLSPGAPGRRPPSASPPGDLRTLTRRLQQRHNVQQLLGHLSRSPQSGGAWIGQVEELMRGLGTDSAESLYELAHTLHAAGRSELAAEVYDLLVKRQPQHALCEPALIWLVQYHASGEAKRLRAKLPAPPEVASPVRRLGDTAADESTVQPASYEAPAAGPLPAGPRLKLERKTLATSQKAQSGAERALGYARWIQNTRPALYHEPCVRFPASTAARAAGQRREAEAFYHALAGGPARDAWSISARSELWLQRPERRPPKPLVRCGKTDQRPQLDGQSHEETWRACMPLALAVPAPGDERLAEPAFVLLTRDREYLYVAARCPKVTGVRYAAANSPRQRDADLSQQDRIELLVDIDRDYVSCCRLTVDHRGWGSESCLDSAAWNPQWFIAAASDDASWSFEAAIPWKELIDNPPEAQDCWALGVRRIVPGAGLQSWVWPAGGAAGPNDFGLLQFE
jgi:photosystem II stability/assembly factor-like uncharacterized protein